MVYSENSTSALDEKWHPFAMLLLALVFAVAIAMLRSPFIISIYLVGAILFFRILGAEIYHTVYTIRYLLWMLPFTFIMHVILTPEGWSFVGALFQGKFLVQNLSRPTAFTLQIFGFLYIMSAVFLLVSGDRIIASTARMLSPLRNLGIPVDNVFQILQVGLRFFPLLRQEAQKIQNVRQGFGIQSGDSITERVKLQLQSVIPLFIGTLRRAEIVSRMMTLRGFQPGRRRSSYIRIPWYFGDSVLTGIAILIGSTIFLL